MHHEQAVMPGNTVFVSGLLAGIPIGLGYLAVAFSLGILARKAGLTGAEGFIASLLTCTSAGEYAVFSVMLHGTTVLEIILITLIINARYILMSCSLSQRLPEDMPFYHRLMLGCTVTDEIFGVTIAKPGNISPYYPYGALMIAAPCWALGTALGITAGNILPERIVSALSVALFGMFLAVIVPASRKDHIVALVVLISFALSFAAIHAPLIGDLSSGNRTILLTLAISAGAAVVFPRTDHAKAGGSKRTVANSVKEG